MRSSARYASLLTQRNAKDLAAYWPDLLSPQNPVLCTLLGATGEVQTAACRALQVILEYGQGFWAMAREPAQKSAFLTHSERLAAMLDHVRRTLASMLSEERTLEPLLDLVCTLVLTTEHVSLATSHAAILWGPVVQCSESKSPEVALRAYAAVAVLHPDDDIHPSFSELAPSAVEALIALLSRNDRTTALFGPRAWSLLAVFLARTDMPVPIEIPSLVSRDVSAPDDTVRRGAIEMLAGLARLGQRTASMPTMRQMLPKLVANAARDTSVEVRMAVCALWADFDLCLAPSTPLHLAHLHVLTRDNAAEVRAAAVRAVGVRIEHIVAHGSDDDVESLLLCFTYETMTRLLHARKPHGLMHDQDLNVRVCAAWTMANYAALLTRAPPRSSQGRALLTAATALPRDEKEAVHAVRALGTLLAVGARNAWFECEHGSRRGSVSSVSSSPTPDSTLAPATPLSPPQSPEVKAQSDGLAPPPVDVPLSTLYTRGIDAACQALAGRSPKLRWNAASSLMKALDAACAASLDGVDHSVEVGVAALARALNDRTFKVQRIAAQALVDLLQAPHAPVLSERSAATLEEHTQKARRNLDARVRRASFAEAQMHARACRTALDALDALLHGDAPQLRVESVDDMPGVAGVEDVLADMSLG